jgi:hypothetical protein
MDFILRQSSSDYQDYGLLEVLSFCELAQLAYIQRVG